MMVGMSAAAEELEWAREGAGACAPAAAPACWGVEGCVRAVKPQAVMVVRKGARDFILGGGGGGDVGRC